MSRVQQRTASEQITDEVRTGPGARTIESDADVRDVIALFRLNYDRVVARRGLPTDTDA